MLGRIVILCIFAVFFIKYIQIGCYAKPDIKKLDSVANMDLRTGDLLLVSCNRTFSIARYFGGLEEWTHVAMIVKVQGELFVYDVCRWHPKHTEFNFSPNKKQECGFLRLEEYLQKKDIYIGVRKLRRHISINDKQVYELCMSQCKRLNYVLNFFRFVYYNTISRNEPLKNHTHDFSCVEAISYIYESLGIQSDTFRVGMTLYPYTACNDHIFEEIVHIYPHDPKLVKKFQQVNKTSRVIV
jgi:hypothetical protein